MKHVTIFKEKEVVNGVETLKIEDGEQDESKQPKVTKAQKRRVSHRFSQNFFFQNKGNELKLN